MMHAQGRKVPVVTPCLWFAWAAMLAWLPAGAGSACAEVRYDVIDIGGFDTTEKNAASGINNSGQVVGWAFLQTGPEEYSQRAFLWEDGVIHDLGALEGETVSNALQINDNGEVAGHSGYAAIHAVAWNVGPQIIRDLGTLGGRHSYGSAINNAGQVVGQSLITGNMTSHAFLWTLEDGMIDLGIMPISPNSRATAVNNSGQIVGFTGSGSDARAIIWEGGTMRYIDTDAETSDDFTFAFSINDSGLVVGSIMPPPCDAGRVAHACVWDLNTGQRTDLGVLSGFDTSALFAVNAAGLAVGEAIAYTAPECHHAFLYAGTGLVDLNSLIDPSSGWTLGGALDINDQGWIVGWGWSPNGQSHGFVLVPVPEPMTLALLSLGGLATMGKQTRRR